jgi:hypothetical protein
MSRGGTAMRKLNDIDAALSFNPICCVCLRKKVTTSYKGIFSNPGNSILLDQRMIGFIGGLSKIMRCNLIMLFNYRIPKLSSAFLYFLALLKCSSAVAAKLCDPEKSAFAQKYK